jgi:hypothetical protein
MHYEELDCTERRLLVGVLSVEELSRGGTGSATCIGRRILKERDDSSIWEAKGQISADLGRVLPHPKQGSFAINRAAGYSNSNS